MRIERKEVSGDKKSQRMRRKKTVNQEDLESVLVCECLRERGSTLGEEGENVLIHKNTASNQCTALSGMRQQYIHVSTEGQKEEKDFAACNPVTQREIQRGGLALEVRTAALATVTVDGLLCRACAQACLRVSLSLSLACFSAAHLPLQSRCQPAASQPEQANCHNLLPQDKGK